MHPRFRYRRCLGLEADAVTLEAEWTALDRSWMDTKMPIQLLHDIEVRCLFPFHSVAPVTGVLPVWPAPR